MKINPMRYVTSTHLTTHACKRFWQYAREKPEIPNKNWTIKKIRQLVGRSIAKQIKLGLVIDKTGATHIPIGWGLYSATLIKPNGYKVVTIHKNNYNIDTKEILEEING